MIRFLINAGVDGICSFPAQLVRRSQEYDFNPYASSSSRSKELTSRPFPLYPKSGDVWDVVEVRSAELDDRPFDEVEGDRDIAEPVVCEDKTLAEEPTTV